MTTLARASDDHTSQLAADYTEDRLQPLQRQFLDALGRLGEATAAEVAAAAVEDSLPIHRESIRKRVGELVAAELIEAVARRRCRLSGRLAMTYRLRRARDE